MSELAQTVAEQESTPAFEVRLDNFEGPFDLLLSLIAKHKLDITEVSLSTVTDEFIAHVKAEEVGLGARADHLVPVVASTLLDLKAARLLPQGDVEDEEDLALLEARDLLFARLLQYRAFKQVAGVIERRLAHEAHRHPRSVGLEDRFATLLPEVLIGIGLEQFAALAARAMEPKPVLEVSLQHIHAPRVSVREQAAVIVDRLRRAGTMTFRALCGDSPDTLTTVARFLALLELFREGAIASRAGPARSASSRCGGPEPRRATSRSTTSSTPRRRTTRTPSRTPPTTRRPRDRADRADRADGRGRHARGSGRGAAPVAGGDPHGRRPAAGPPDPRLGGGVRRRRGRDGAGRPRPRSTPPRAAASSSATWPAGERFYTREEYAAVVEGFVLDGQQARLTQAALEDTLAVVAYRAAGVSCPGLGHPRVNVDG